MNKKEVMKDNGWRSRKLWFAIISFVVLIVAAFMGVLTTNLLIGLVGIPAAYGFANVSVKKIGIASFEAKE